MKVAIVIPARLDSTRLKHKMLLKFNGRSLIRTVFEKCVAMGFDTYVATDSSRIASRIPVANIIKTAECKDGTERISKAINGKLSKYDAIINVQGDMIDIDLQTLKPLLNYCKAGKIGDWDVITAYTEGYKPNDVKVIHNYGKALWFTRNNIGYGDRHIGLYAYQAHVLTSLDLLTDKYKVENLEQNKLLGYYEVRVVKTKYNGIEINTQEDVNSWSLLNRKRGDGFKVSN